MEAIDKVINISHPAVIADLGGGTGFILHELSRRLDLTEARLVNIDVSPRQLSTCDDTRIELLQASASKFTRQQLRAENGDLQLIARSLLHYFGRLGIGQILRHIHDQLREGEFFVHQSACFQSSSDASCLNLIYRLMGTDKWYCTTGEMMEMLEQEGWEICSLSSAPMLHLSSEDLSQRYQLSPDQVEQIKMEAERKYGRKRDVFVINKTGFEAWLHYHIFVCQA